jgi:hypothetical protein
VADIFLPIQIENVELKVEQLFSEAVDAAGQKLQEVLTHIEKP